MPYTDLLRASVFITAAEATALGAITALAANRDGDTTVAGVAAGWAPPAPAATGAGDPPAAVVAAGWGLVALALGIPLGRPRGAAADARDAPARPRPAPPLPAKPPPRIPLPRLWPIAFTAIAAG